jgi:hypothetical protein
MAFRSGRVFRAGSDARETGVALRLAGAFHFADRDRSFLINPARTIGSAVFANVWTAAWLYFVAPVLGMMTSAEIYLRAYGIEKVLCAKLHPDPSYPCPFLCQFPFHRHLDKADLSVGTNLQ